LTGSKNGGGYAGGDFEEAGDCDSGDGCNYIAEWDDKTEKWMPLKSGMDGYVISLIKDSRGDLFAGGDFREAGNCSELNGCTGIAMWDTSAGKWSPLGGGLADTVYAMAWSGENYLFAGGSFDSISGCSSEDGCNYIAKWDPSDKEWIPLDIGMNDQVNALVSDNKFQLFAGGYFSTAGDTVSNKIALWIYGLDNKSYLPMVVR